MSASDGRNPDKVEPTPEPDDQIAALLNEYFDRRQRGEGLTPERFSAEHPESADALRPYLEGLTLLDRIRNVTTGSGTPPVAGPTSGQLPTIAGYKLLEEVGRGGMGVVYKALQIATKRNVAVKVMLSGPFASPKAQRRFDREVQLAARLRHPRIVTVLESGQVASGQKYFAMDYVSGSPLDVYLAQAHRDRRAILALFIDICEAVDYAHNNDVIHRDIKPANVLIDVNGNPHIMDFGLAKDVDSRDKDDTVSGDVSMPGQVLGTLRYLSPEQAAGTVEEVDVRTDVYALGVMLYEALTGVLPYDTSGRPSEVIRRIQEDPPVRPSGLKSGIDSELETILLKALEKEQARRYASAREMGEDLRRYLAGEPILAKRASTLYLLRKAVRRHRAHLAVAAVALALGVGGLLGGFAWSQHVLERQRAEQVAVARSEVQRLQLGLEFGDTELSKEALYAFARHHDVPEATLVSARARWEDGLVDEAIEMLRGELSATPSSWACRELLAEFYRHLIDEPDAAKQAAVDQAVVERQAPNSAEAWYARSFTTFDQEVALDRAARATVLDPGMALAWERIAGLNENLGYLQGALAAVRKLASLAPQDPRWRQRAARLEARISNLTSTTTATSAPSQL